MFQKTIGKAELSKVRFGMARLARYNLAWQGWQGTIWHGKVGKVQFGMARLLGKAGFSKVRFGMARLARLNCHVKVGKAKLVRQPIFWQGKI